MAFVIDASIAASWFLPDEFSTSSEGLIRELGKAPGLVPSLFWFETRNLFVMAERRGRLPQGGALAACLKLRGMPLRDGGIGQDVSIVDVALRCGLSVYDASYVALAKLNSLPLATLDGKMADAARKEGVRVIDRTDPHD